MEHFYDGYVVNDADFGRYPIREWIVLGRFINGFYYYV